MPKRPLTQAQAEEHNAKVLSQRGQPTEDEVAAFEARYGRPWPRRRQDPGPSPRDQYWTLRRGWTGEEYFVPSTERNEWVSSQYNPLDALKDD
jgi:hypothetical protein